MWEISRPGKPRLIAFSVYVREITNGAERTFAQFSSETVLFNIFTSYVIEKEEEKYVTFYKVNEKSA